MGLFGKGFDEKAALLGFFSPQAGQMYSSRKRGEESRRREAEELAKVHATIDADPGLPTPEAKAYAKMNPKAYIEAYMTRFKTVEMGAAGGSVGRMGADGQMAWQQAPSRHEYQGSIYDVGPTAPGRKAVVTPQHEGTQWVTPQPGTTAFGVNSFNGLPRSGSTAAAPPAPTAGPTPGTVEDGHVFKGGDPADPASWTPLPQGGAGLTAPRTFPRPY